MSMKKPYSIGMILLLLGLLHGCLFPAMWSNPGYMISIEIQKVNKKDVVLVESVLREHNFNMATQHVTGERCVWYIKTSGGQTSGGQTLNIEYTWQGCNNTLF